MYTSIIRSRNIDISKIKYSLGKVEKQENNISLTISNQEPPKPLSIILEYKDYSFFNNVLFEFQKNFKKELMANIFYSDDGIIWKKISIQNKDESEIFTVYKFSLIRSKYMQIVLTHFDGSGIGNLHLKNIQVKLQNNIKLTATSSFDRLWTIENLIDGREDYGWSSSNYKDLSKKQDIIEIDLSNHFFINEIRLCSVKDNPSCFPTSFSVYSSSDKAKWDFLFSENEFFTASFSWYSWHFNTVRSKYLKIIIDSYYKLKKDSYIAKILELDILATAENVITSNIINQNGYASEMIPGIMLFSENNGTKPYRAVQSNDSRLRLSSEEYPGIVQLAKDKESRANLAIQSNDSRLRLSSEEYPGIVQLAKDKESRANLAIQSNDSRLRLSSEEYPGIVQLAKDKESRANLAIQSNDSRLRLSSEEYPGIVQLAKDQEIRSGLVVQSTDSRLKNGTVTKSGIIQFAKHNEFASEKAIQSDDPRLIEGSTERKGRIQFAKDLEIASLKAIQANDSRLKKATTKNYGIVCLAEHGKKIKETAVQSDDPRLEDRRKPLPHEHDYALKVHDFSSHTGNIHIESDIKTSSISNMKLPNLESMPFGIKNKSGWAGGFYGGLICKNDKEQAIFAVSENNYALEALSKNNGGALFFSENSYAVNIPSTIYNLKSSNKSLIAEGLVTLKGGLEVSGSYSVVVSWHKFSSAVFVEGDLLTINENNEIDKAKNKNDIIIGVYIKNPSFKLGGFNKIKNIFIAVSGIAKIRIKGSIKAGNKIFFDASEPGIAKSVLSENKKEIVGISLESYNDDKEKLVWCILRLC